MPEACRPRGKRGLLYTSLGHLTPHIGSTFLRYREVQARSGPHGEGAMPAEHMQKAQAIRTAMPRSCMDKQPSQENDAVVYVKGAYHFSSPFRREVGRW